jgi:hypothetical protein
MKTFSKLALVALCLAVTPAFVHASDSAVHSKAKTHVAGKTQVAGKKHHKKKHRHKKK